MLPPLDDLPSKYRTPSQRAYSDEERTCRSSGTSSPTSFGGVCTCFHCSISIGTKGSGINFHHRLNCQLQLTPSLSSKLIRLLLQRRTPWTAYVAGKICSALYCEFSWRRDEAIPVSPEHFRRYQVGPPRRGEVASPHFEICWIGAPPSAASPEVLLDTVSARSGERDGVAPRCLK